MSDPVGDDNAGSEYIRYMPKRPRDQAAVPGAERSPERPAAHVGSVSPVPWSADAREERRTRSESALWPEPVPEPPPQREDRVLPLIGRLARVAIIAAAVALLAVFGRPVLERLRPLLSLDTTNQVSKSDERQTANAVQPNAALAPAAAIAAAHTGVPAANAPAQHPPLRADQQAALSPITNPLEQESPSDTVRGVTDNEIRFGISAPFSGPAKELGQNMKLGIESAFDVANANGGIFGRRLRLVTVDDGYEPARTAVTMKELYEKDRVFGLIGNVGTPTAVVALPYALQRKMLFFGAFTGAGLLRNDPPDRYVFNYRASYAEETAAVVNYLVKVKRLSPEQIAVFAQQDAYGDAGFAGVEKAIRSLRGGNQSPILRLNYQRNTIDVDDAVAQLQRRRRIPIRAVIMVPTYRAAARFIEKTHDLYPQMIYTSVSFVGSTALANELMLLGKSYANGVIVTQVVPAVDGHSSLVLAYKSALAKYFPGEALDYVSLEGYVDAGVLIAALQRNGQQLDAESLVDSFENLRNLDVGLGTPVSFSPSDHQGVHKVWGTQLDANGHYQPVDLQ